MDPISAGAAFGFINSAFKFSEFAVRLYEVGSENEVFVRLIQRVRKDLEETERVLHVESVKRKLSSTPGKLPWVMSAIHSTKQALDDIGRWVERVRADKEGYGTVSFENRVRWVFNDHEKLVNRSMELATCHQTLSTVLAYLSPLEEASAAAADAAPPSYDDATHFDDFLSPRQRKRKTTAETTKAGVDGVEKSAVVLPTPLVNAQTIVSLALLPNEMSPQDGGHADMAKASAPHAPGIILARKKSSPWDLATGSASILSNETRLAQSNTPGAWNCSRLFPSSSPSQPRRTSVGVESSPENAAIVPRRPVPAQSPFLQPSTLPWPLMPTTSPLMPTPSSTAPHSPSWDMSNSSCHRLLEEAPISPTSSRPRSLTQPEPSLPHQLQNLPTLPYSSVSSTSTNSTFRTWSSPLTEAATTAPIHIVREYPVSQLSYCSSMSPTPSRPQLAQASELIAGTNSLGPVNPFELYDESQSQPSKPALPTRSTPPETQSSTAHESIHQADSAAEMLGDLSFCHPGDQRFPAELAGDMLAAGSSTNNFMPELSVGVPFWHQKSPSAGILGHSLYRGRGPQYPLAEMPEDPTQHQLHGHETIPLYTASQRPQNQYPDRSFTALTPTNQQQSCATSPYPASTSTSQFRALSPVGFAPLSMPWPPSATRQDLTAVSPLTQPATPVLQESQLAGSITRSETMVSGRMRKQNAILDLMGSMRDE